MKSVPRTSICPKFGCVQHTLTIIGDKWTALLLRELTESPKTFTELESKLIGISPRTLSQRLSKLEYEAIIQPKEYCARPPRYKYVLTQKGIDLQQVLHDMASWGEKYNSDHS